MTRGPVWGERCLVDVTLNTGNKQRIALVQENYAPSVLAGLKAELPNVPGLAEWEIVRAEPLSDETNGQPSLR